MNRTALLTLVILAIVSGCQSAHGTSTESDGPRGVVRQADSSNTPIYSNPDANQVIQGAFSLTLDSAIAGKINNIRIVDGVKFITIAAAVADLGTAPGWVIIPPGTYNVTDTITISNMGQHILGAGKWATQINFNPSSAKPLFAFTKSAISCTPVSSCRVLYQTSIGGMMIYGTGSEEKTAILAEDVSDLLIHDILIGGDAVAGNAYVWSGGTTSIGIDLHGRDMTTLRKVYVAAQRPINLGLNPNLASCTTYGYCVSQDHLHMEDLTLVAAPGEANIKVAPGSVLQNWTIDGTNSMNQGDYGILWNETEQVVQISQNFSWSNIRWEQQSSPYGYGFYRNRVDGANHIYNMAITNFAAGSGANGFFLRGTVGVTLTNCTYLGNASSTGLSTDPYAINADSTNYNLQVINPFFQTGSTVSIAPTSLGVSQYLSGRIEGHGAFELAAGAACLATGTGDRFLVWNPGTAYTCDQACANVSCNGTASCVHGWTMWPGSVNYRYSNECTVADPSNNQGISGKLCCCTGSNCSQPLYK